MSWPSRSTSSIFVLRRSFFTAKTYWQSFLLENFTMTFALILLTLWQAFMRLEGIFQYNFLKMFSTFSSITSASTLLEMPVMSRQSHFINWALAQHWRSIFTSVSCKTRNHLQNIQTTHKPTKPPTNYPQSCQTTHKSATPPTN